MSPVEKIPRLPLKNAQFCELMSEENLYTFYETQSVRNFNNLGLVINSANVLMIILLSLCKNGERETSTAVLYVP